MQELDGWGIIMLKPDFTERKDIVIQRRRKPRCCQECHTKIFQLMNGNGVQAISSSKASFQDNSKATNSKSQAQIVPGLLNVNA